MPTKLDQIPDFMLKCGEDAAKENVSLMKFQIGPFLVILPMDHEAVKNILNSNVELTKGRDYSFFEQWLGPGLLLGDGERWQKARKMATPAFHFSKLDEYAQTIDYHCRTLVDILKKETNKNINMYNYIKLCALDIIADTTMGVQLNAQQNSDQPYVHAVEEFNRLACYRSLRTFLRPDFMWSLTGYAREQNKSVKILHSFTEKVIKERMEVYKQDTDGLNQQRPNFLDLMLQLKDSEKLSEEHLREEVDTIVFAGHDTTAHALSWAVWCFATHPEIQQRVYDELIEHFGESDSGFCTKQLKELKYFDMCFKEVLRLFPPVPAVQRFIKNELEMCGHVIPRLTSLTIPIILLHRNPRVFKEPNVFNPENFADGKEYPALGFIPFSAGPRNCVGQKFAKMEVKIMLAHLLFNFRVETDTKFEDNKMMFEVVLRPSLGVPVRLVKRNH
ncbi:hypothetical protein M3Y97_00648700 [Aphelenchoides bicaudatus]|nr:hypothetical protein M3Y97_00648700 [Aphelenchoides bicaudatus]